jgi:hypothetical protein
VNEEYMDRKKLTWNPLIREDHWSIGFTEASLGDIVIPTKCNELIVDTGTSYFLVHTCNLFDW